MSKKINKNNIIQIKTVILGAGASGLMVAAKSGDRNTLIVEKKHKVGSKILASGNGRCNMSNLEIHDVSMVLEAFKGIGVYTKDINNWVYPRSEDAKDVVDALEYEAKSRGVKFLLGTSVNKVISLKDEVSTYNFLLISNEYQILCKNLVMATGGKSMSKLGTTGDGYRFAKELGHSITKLVPVLTAIETKEDIEKLKLKGIRQKGRASLVFKDEILLEELGEVQFTGYGISGICIFNLSRLMMIPKDRTLKDGFDDYKIYIDFIPDIEECDLKELFCRNLEKKGFGDDNAIKNLNDREKSFLILNLLRSWIKQGLVSEIIRRIDTSKISSIDTLLRVVIQGAKAFKMNPKGVKGWEFAQVTRGGVSLDEVDEINLQSKIVPNLYFCGEVLDYDGPCGGYNLQHAWKTGIIIAEELKRKINNENI